MVMAKLTFEAEISPGMTSRQVVDLARRAEEAGFDRLGVSGVVFWPERCALLGLIASPTTKIELGPMVTNAYTRHPAVPASAMATWKDAIGGPPFPAIDDLVAT